MITFQCKCGRIVETAKPHQKVCDKCRKPIIVNGYTHLPKFLRLAYLRATNNHCQECKRQFSDSELEIHRIIRGNQGGKYTVAKLNSKENNVKVVCNSCHKRLHSYEFL